VPSKPCARQFIAQNPDNPDVKTRTKFSGWLMLTVSGEESIEMPRHITV
jgi:hypothetical protein